MNKHLRRAMLADYSETREERILREGMVSNAKIFAETGNPWISGDDWVREEQRAANPAAPGHASAADFTRRASVFPKMARPRRDLRPEPRPGPSPLSERAALAREIANLRSFKRDWQRRLKNHNMR